MWRYLFIGLLLLQGANAQPAKQKTQGQQQQPASSVSPTPLNESQVETGNKPNSANNDQQAKQDREAKAFQQTQIRQYWVLVITSIVTAVLFIAYTVFCGLQWWQIKKQATNAEEQVIKMQLTLEAVQDQGKTLRRQAIGTTSQARSTRDLVGQNKEIVEK